MCTSLAKLPNYPKLRFYALNFFADSRNIEFIVMIRNIVTVDRGSFLRQRLSFTLLSLLGQNVLHEQCIPCKARKACVLERVWWMSDDCFLLTIIKLKENEGK